MEQIVEIIEKGAITSYVAVDELIRCKDCRFYTHTFCYGCRKFGTVVHNNPEWYCAEAEKRDEDE